MSSNVDQLAVNTIRALSADMVQKANSGHPGMPMGMAPVAHVLFSRVLNFNSANAKWWNRDRFLLSNGHGCALQYSLLHLAGYKVSMDDLKNFRQIGSVTPGHPEVHMTEGVEVTTGPLGQGIGNGVGLAVAEAHLAARYNKGDLKLFDNFTYVFCGDGCMQEGVASEAASLAGHLKLNKLIVIYDDNKVQIDGPTDLAFTEDVPARFRAYGWNTLSVKDGDNDLNGIQAAIEQAKQSDKPTLISLHTTIGFGSKKQGTDAVHGAPLGADDLKHVKTFLGLNPDVSFNVPQEVYDIYKQAITRGAAKEAAWNQLWSQYQQQYPAEAQELKQRFNHELPAGWENALPKWKATDKADATRNTSGVVLNALADVIPGIMGGSADLTPSNKTELKKSKDFTPTNHSGRYMRFGVREHGMAAIGNGMSAYGGFIPYTATFLNFVQYCLPSVRLAALSNLKQLFIMTHDSIGLGEDGPTHQPVEALTQCRLTPNLLLFRPADGNETAGSYAIAIQHNGPSVLALSRQNLPQLENSSVENVKKGGYIVLDVEDSKTLDVVLVASGSEVGETLKAAKALAPLKVRVVSMPSTSLFDEQSVEYRRSVLPVGVPIISVEAGSVLGWERYSHASIGMTTFGLSGPYEKVLAHFNFLGEGIAERVKHHLSVLAQLGKVGPVATHFDFGYAKHTAHH